MPSPFPGMNPYLEQAIAWHDFHQAFIARARDVLAPQVRPRYYVKIDEHIYLHELEQEERRLVGHADLGVGEVHRGHVRPSGMNTLEAPAQVLLPPAVDVERHSFLEIRDREGQQIVTVLEMLSPSNKRAGSDREQYVNKRMQLLSSPVNLVELDLLRGSPRLPLINLPACDYYVLVSRAEQRPEAGVWPVRLADRLPVIPVPLRAGEADATLDLQELLHQVYDAAGYDLYIYGGSPEPALTAEQTAWARGFLPPVTP